MLANNSLFRSSGRLIVRSCLIQSLEVLVEGAEGRANRIFPIVGNSRSMFLVVEDGVAIHEVRVCGQGPGEGLRTANVVFHEKHVGLFA